MLSFFYKMIIVFGFIFLFHSAFSAAQHLRTAQEFTGLPLDIVFEAVTGLFTIMWGVLKVARSRREIQAEAEVNQTKCDTQCNLPSYCIVNHRGKALSADYLPDSSKAELEKTVSMAAQEDEIKSLKEVINLVKEEVHHWKAMAAQRENEKLNILKENNELRQKVIRLKSDGAADARKLAKTLKSASKKALAVSRCIELAYTYMRDREAMIPIEQPCCIRRWKGEEFIADHPFLLLLMIRDIPIFYGVVCRPSRKRARPAP